MSKQEAGKQEIVAVVFLKHWRGYNPGETAAFPADQADRLEAGDVAEKSGTASGAVTSGRGARGAAGRGGGKSAARDAAQTADGESGADGTPAASAAAATAAASAEAGLGAGAAGNLNADRP
ncbi:hypothetical protein [Delftia sp. UME58]|uniref:hypothetical protein n=1 Tax=Delftia sp. UME58 TaxID=1862322 RepID=UPI0015FEFEF6|nr:hypothetical protein [Delftia sp. UME58]